MCGGVGQERGPDVGPLIAHLLALTHFSLTRGSAHRSESDREQRTDEEQPGVVPTMGTVVTTPDTGHYRSGRDGLPAAHQPGQLSELPLPSTSGPRSGSGHGRWLVSDSQEIDMTRSAGHPGVRTKNTLLLPGEVGAHPAHPVLVHAPSAPPRVRRPWTGNRHRPPVPAALGLAPRSTPRLLPRVPLRDTDAFCLWQPGRQRPTDLARWRGASFHWGAEHGGQHRPEHPPHLFAPSVAALAMPPARLLHDFLLRHQVGITPWAGVCPPVWGIPFFFSDQPRGEGWSFSLCGSG